MGRGRQPAASQPAVTPPAAITIPDLSGMLVAAAVRQAADHHFRLALAGPYAPLTELQSSGRWVVSAQEPVGGSGRFAGDSVVIALTHQGGPDIRDREPRNPLPPRLSQRAPLPVDRVAHSGPAERG